jgi:hypothetical protein
MYSGKIAVPPGGGGIRNTVESFIQEDEIIMFPQNYKQYKKSKVGAFFYFDLKN